MNKIDMDNYKARKKELEQGNKRDRASTIYDWVRTKRIKCRVFAALIKLV